MAISHLYRSPSLTFRVPLFSGRTVFIRELSPSSGHEDDSAKPSLVFRSQGLDAVASYAGGLDEEG